MYIYVVQGQFQHSYLSLWNGEHIRCVILPVTTVSEENVTNCLYVLCDQCSDTVTRSEVEQLMAALFPMATSICVPLEKRDIHRAGMDRESVSSVMSG